MTIAVDFDGTIVEHKYPAIGAPIPFAIETLIKLREERHKLILWSVREGELLNEAVRNQRTQDFLKKASGGLVHRRQKHRRTTRLGNDIPHGSRSSDIRRHSSGIFRWFKRKKK